MARPARGEAAWLSRIEQLAGTRPDQLPPNPTYLAGAAASVLVAAAERLQRQSPRKIVVLRRPAMLPTRGCQAGVPQLPQNRVPGARSLPQFLHLPSPTGEPQFEQNFSDPTGLPQFVQTVVRVERSPLNCVDPDIACCIWLICCCARAASISVASFGAQFTHRPRSSFQQVSSTHRLLRGQRLK